MSETASYADPMSVTVGSHVPARVAEQLAQLAKTNERSVSGELRVAIRRHLADASCGLVPSPQSP